MNLFYGTSPLFALALVTCASLRLNIPDDINLLSVRDDATHEDLTPRDRTYDLAVAKGEALMNQFRTNQYTAPITGGTTVDSRIQGWRINPVPPPWGIAVLDGNLRIMLLRLFGRVVHQYYEWSANYDHNDEHAYYRNLYGPVDGLIAALDTFNGVVSTPMSNWSELSWRIWANLCESVDIDPKTLRYIIRHEIQNDQTEDIIMQVYHEAFSNHKVGDPIMLFSSGRTLQAFHALIGSPNGSGVAWMLLNKRNVLGKTIAKITVELGQEEWQMLFELEPITVAPSSDMTG